MNIRIHILCRRTLRAAFLSSLNILATVATPPTACYCSQCFGYCWLRWFYITPQLSFLNATHSPNSNSREWTYISREKRHIIFQKKTHTIAHEVLTDNCMVSVGQCIRGISTWSLAAARVTRTHHTHVEMIAILLHGSPTWYDVNVGIFVFNWHHKIWTTKITIINFV